MPKYDLLVARFPGRGWEASPCVDWLIEAHRKLDRDPRFARVDKWRITDTPITMGRNRCLKVALEEGYDYVLMVDDDLAPDYYAGACPRAKPFLDVALDFALAHHGPCVVAAPYMGPPPKENVYVFRWRRWESDRPDFSGSLEQYTREEAAEMGGIAECAALPTGLMLIDMRGVRRLMEARAKAAERLHQEGRPFELKAPFYYEWTDPLWQHEKASTEDVTFTRDLSMAGVPQYCAWDSWAGHIKTKTVGRPELLTVDAVNAAMREAVSSNRRQGERRQLVRRPPLPKPPAAVIGDVTITGADHA